MTATATTITIDRLADCRQRPCPPLVVQRDDGMFEIGIGIDPAGPFETRTFAEEVAGISRLIAAATALSTAC
jgi:hypothetical protein